MPKSIALELSVSEFAELDALIERSLAEGKLLDRQMNEDQERIARLKEETQLIAGETQRNLERLHEEVALLKAA